MSQFVPTESFSAETLQTRKEWHEIFHSTEGLKKKLPTSNTLLSKTIL
jgi:hypothetical protein